MFNSNQRLEELTFYTLDFGLFQRHDIDGTILPFVVLLSGEDLLIRTLVTDGDVMEYAKTVLNKEEKPFQQFAICIEGILRDEKGDGIDAIIVQSFDVTQDKGVVLAQQFQPKENGSFKLLDKIIFLGNPDLILDRQTLESPIYETQEIGFNAIAAEKDGLIDYTAVFVHENPSVISRNVRQFLSNRLLGDKQAQLSGKFSLDILTHEKHYVDFLKFVLNNSIFQILNAEEVKQWVKENKRPLHIICKYGEETIAEGKIATDDVHNQSDDSGIEKTDDEVLQHKYASYSLEELDAEFIQILNTPNARTNVDCLKKVVLLKKEYEKRGVKMPHERKTKKWWQFWK
ncbi:MAG: hypothetical protein E6767_09255 [Dysgonomonas sp.]|nr:hypothetical protein [Dysgonomonas sp.]